jgi:hypothetical protein
MKSMASKGIAAFPQKSQLGYFLWGQNEMVRSIADVESHRLLQDHTFQYKETLQLCIAEEANLHQLKVKMIRSDHNNIIVAGSNFYVYATYSVHSGWMVRNSCCREGDNTSVIPPNHLATQKKTLNTPTQLLRQLRKWVTQSTSCSPTDVK